MAHVGWCVFISVPWKLPPVLPLVGDGDVLPTPLLGVGEEDPPAPLAGGVTEPPDEGVLGAALPIAGGKVGSCEPGPTLPGNAGMIPGGPLISKLRDIMEPPGLYFAIP